MAATGAFDPRGPVVIAGAGQAGATLAGALRERGWRGTIHLVGDEEHVPYQRPPLSKGFLLGTEGEADLMLGSPAAMARDGIVHLPGRRVVRLDREGRVAVLDDGSLLPYAAAVLATGTAARTLPLAGIGLDGVHTLRTVADSAALRAALGAAREVVVVGGGFLGLEVATAAATARVTVLEGAGRILARAVSEPVAARLRTAHERLGAEVRTGIALAAITGTERVEGVLLAGGEHLSADLVLIAVGASPNTAVAEASGLTVDDGVVVDQTLCTGDPAVFAIGDCARFPNAFLGSDVRLESVQNATDQARHVAALLTGGDPGPYRALPWFWSHQAGRNLQIAGLACPEDAVVVIDDDDGLIVERRRDGRVVAVETLDNPRAHVRARRSLAAALAEARPSPSSCDSDGGALRAG